MFKSTHVLPLSPSFALTAALDLAARLAVPASLWAATRGFGNLAVIAAAASSALAVARGIASGKTSEQASKAMWRALTTAACSRSVAGLRGRPRDQAVTSLFHASAQVATAHGQTRPRLYADLGGLALVALATGLRFGVLALALGVALASAAGLVLSLGRRRIQRLEAAGFALIPDVAERLAILLDGAAELRANARQEPFRQKLEETIATMAGYRRQLSTMSSLVGLLPLTVALLAATLSGRGHGGWIADALGGAGAAEAALLAMTAFVLALDVVRCLEGLIRADASEKLVRAFLQLPQASEAPERAAADASWLDDIAFEGVSMRYPGATNLTPERFSHDWTQARGLVLVGNNGSGKSTLLLALLGLIQPTEGQIIIGGRALNHLDLESLRQRVVYLPQRPALVQSETVQWHLRLFCGDDPSRETLLQALAEVGLSEAAPSAQPNLLERVVADLSGGELSRMHLARLLLPHPHGHPELVVVDEPDGALDEDGRRLLKHLLARLAKRSRVLAITHDQSIAPPTFAVARVQATAPATGVLAADLEK